jgi:hypothetical protein
MNSERMIDALPAHKVLQMVLQLQHFYFPDAFRVRFEKVATFFESKNQLYWIERIRTRTDDLRTALRKLGDWDDIFEPDLLLNVGVNFEHAEPELAFFIALRARIFD